LGKILIAEDEEAIREFIVINMENEGFETVTADDGESALMEFDSALKSKPFDVALLDIMMPKINGVEVCGKIREKDKYSGIIMLSAKSQEKDKITALAKGADDYVTKPFSVKELVARVNAVYRRVQRSKDAILNNNNASPADESGNAPAAMSETPSPDKITSGPFTVNTGKHTVKKNDKLIELTPFEYQLLIYFMLNGDKVLSKKNILINVWGETYNDVKIVDVNIRRLRMKIESNPAKPEYISTVWGTGYKWGIET
jgi:DNA-binding response OmpR family regulator